MPSAFKKYLPLIILVIIAVGGYSVWSSMRNSVPEGFAYGNGRLEATEIDISAKLAGRIEKILVNEGDFVKKGDVLAIMQTDTLRAQLAEAQAQKQEAIASEANAKAQVVLRNSDYTAAVAMVAERESDLDQVQRHLKRSSQLVKTGAMAAQQLDDDETNTAAAKAAVASATAQVAVAQAAVSAAQAQVVGAESNIQAAQATIDRIQADISDSSLIAPRSGRIQYRIAQEGEVLGAGGKVLNLVDLADVYMTFFLPTDQAGRLALGSDVRMIFDAAPQYVVPGKISYVASTAQFTPKTVETREEREKLMFRIKGQIDPDLLEKHLPQVKVGVPGVAWVKLDSAREWPANLEVKVP